LADSPQQVVLKDPTGAIVTVAPEDAHDALASGYSTTTPEEYQAAVFKAQHETTGQQLGTFAEGVAHAALPWAPAIEQGLGISTIPEQEARATVNPKLAATGQFVGAGLQAAGVAAATGGIAEALSPAAEAAQGVAEGTDAAEAVAAAGSTPAAASAAANTAAVQGPVSLGDAVFNGKVLGYAEQAAAGAAQGGTNYINETELGDHEFNGQSMAAEIGIGALLGVTGQAGINILGEKVLPAVISKADEVLGSVGDKFKTGFTTLSDKVNQLEPGTTAAAWDALFSGAKRPGAKVASDIAEGIDQVGDLLTNAGKAHETGFRRQEAVRNLADVHATQIEPHLSALSNRIDQALGTAEQQFGQDAKYLIKPIAEAKTMLDSVINDVTATVSDKHAALLDFKRDVGSTLFAKRGGVLTDKEAALKSLLTGDVWGAAADNLKSPQVWGPAQAGRNAALDAVTRQKINAAKQVAKDFGATELDLDSGERELYTKPSRILAALKADPLTSQEKLQHLGEYMDAVKNYMDQVKVSARTAGAEVPGGSELHDLLEHLTAQRAAGQSYAPVTELIKQARTQPPLGLGAAGAAPLAGYAAHALGAGSGVVAPVVAAVAALRSPVKAMQAFSTISKTAAAARGSIGTAVRKVFASGPASAAVVSAALTPLRGRTMQSVTGQASGQDFQRQAKHITALAADQDRQADALAKNTSAISGVAPLTTQAMHQAAVQGLNVLAANVPRNPAPSLIPSENKDWEPSQDQIDKWNDIHNAILKPNSYLDKLADGTATQEAWAALQQAYPAWTREVSSQAMQHLVTHPKLELDEGQKLTASMLLGGPVSPSVAPEQVAFQQMAFVPAPKPNQGHGARRRPSQHGLDKLNVGERSSLTGAERL
jgi:hypothetical protein